MRLLLIAFLTLVAACSRERGLFPDKAATTLASFHDAVDRQDWPTVEQLLDKNVVRRLRHDNQDIPMIAPELSRRMREDLPTAPTVVTSGEVTAYLVWTNARGFGGTLSAVYVGKPSELARLTNNLDGYFRWEAISYTAEEDAAWRIAPLLGDAATLGEFVFADVATHRRPPINAYLATTEAKRLCTQALLEQNTSAMEALRDAIRAIIDRTPSAPAVVTNAQATTQTASTAQPDRPAQVTVVAPTAAIIPRVMPRTRTLGGSYTFDEGRGEAAREPNHHHARVVDATYAPGISGTGLHFRSVISHVLVPPTVFDGFGNTAYFEAWIRPASLPGEGCTGVIFRKTAEYNDWWLALKPNGQLESVLYDSTTRSGHHAIATGGLIRKGRWTKVASWYDGKELQILVGDGRIVASHHRPQTLDWKKGYYRTEIGNATQHGECAAFHGDIDEVRIAPTPP